MTSGWKLLLRNRKQACWICNFVVGWWSKVGAQGWSAWEYHLWRIHHSKRQRDEYDISYQSYEEVGDQPVHRVTPCIRQIRCSHSYTNSTPCGQTTGGERAPQLHLQVSAYIHVQTYMYIHVQTYMSYIYIYTHTYIYIHKHIYTHLYTNTQIHTHTHINVYIYTYTYIDRHTYIQREIMLFIGKPKGRSMMISNHIYTYI